MWNVFGVDEVLLSSWMYVSSIFDCRLDSSKSILNGRVVTLATTLGGLEALEFDWPWVLVVVVALFIVNVWR